MSLGGHMQGSWLSIDNMEGSGELHAKLWTLEMYLLEVL